MAVLPTVRYMILCEDWAVDIINPRRINIFGLLSNIHSVDFPAYPLLYKEMCVFLALAEVRGTATARIVCLFEETGQCVFETSERSIAFRNDPLEVVAVPFRIRDCIFPQKGIYLLQFWYNNYLVEEKPLRLR